MIVYKKTDECTLCDNEWQRVAASGTMSDNKWKRVTTDDNEWYNEWQRVTNENEWKRIRTRKESDFGFRMKQDMQCITTIYSAL